MSSSDSIFIGKDYSGEYFVQNSSLTPKELQKISLFVRQQYSKHKLIPSIDTPFLISLFPDAQQAYHLAGIFWQRVCVSARWYAAIGSRLLIQAFTYQ